MTEKDWNLQTLRTAIKPLLESDWKQFFQEEKTLDTIHFELLKLSLPHIITSDRQIPVEFWEQLSDHEKNVVMALASYTLAPTAKIYPVVSRVFFAFSLTSLQNLKCVIIGQDPYPSAGVANGLAFSAQRGAAKPASLKNVFLKLNQEGFVAENPCLESWARQGVLLINTALTVFEGKPESHLELWKPFTINLIKFLGKKEGIVWILWGKKAQAFLPFISQEKSLVLIGAHPSPVNVRGGFLDHDYFRPCNVFLEKIGKNPIDWNLRKGVF